MQRCLDLLQDCQEVKAVGKSKIHTVHIHSHATCIHIHLTSIPSRATYTWTLSWSCSTCMSLVSRCWPGCFEKPVAAGCVVFRRNRAVLCRQSWQSNFWRHCFASLQWVDPLCQCTSNISRFVAQANMLQSIGVQKRSPGQLYSCVWHSQSWAAKYRVGFGLNYPCHSLILSHISKTTT